MNKALIQNEDYSEKSYSLPVKLEDQIDQAKEYLSKPIDEALLVQQKTHQTILKTLAPVRSNAQAIGMFRILI